MRRQFFFVMLALGCAAAVVPGATAHAALFAQADSTLAPPDSIPASTIQAAPPVSTPPPPATPITPAPSQPNERVYYGGTVTLSFGSSTRIGVFPMVGYMLTPKLSGGVEAGYEYVDYGAESSHNYGGSVFGRFHPRRTMYAHVEYQAVNYEVFTGPNSSRREWVPFLLVGGGVVKPISARTAVYAEVLFDVLQDDKSPYDDWEPVVSVGVGVGL